LTEDNQWAGGREIAAGSIAAAVALKDKDFQTSLYAGSN
jgi:hypothetical protein